MHRAMALRQAFDASFAELPTAAREPQDDFVVLGMGEARCAVAMRQLGGLHADLEILSSSWGWRCSAGCSCRSTTWRF